jgi:hypothetical protein
MYKILKVNYMVGLTYRENKNCGCMTCILDVMCPTCGDPFRKAIVSESCIEYAEYSLKNIMFLYYSNSLILHKVESQFIQSHLI